MHATMPSQFKENVLPTLADWRRSGHRAALATVVYVDGSAPRPRGSQMAIREDGVAIGSYPFFKQGRVGANFVVRSEEERLARKVAGELESALASAGYEPVEGGI